MLEKAYLNEKHVCNDVLEPYSDKEPDWQEDDDNLGHNVLCARTHPDSDTDQPVAT